MHRLIMRPLGGLGRRVGAPGCSGRLGSLCYRRWWTFTRETVLTRSGTGLVWGRGRWSVLWGSRRLLILLISSGYLYLVLILLDFVLE